MRAGRVEVVALLVGTDAVETAKGVPDHGMMTPFQDIDRRMHLTCVKAVLMAGCTSNQFQSIDLGPARYVFV